MRASLRLNVLGPFQVLLPGREAVLSNKKAQALLTYLAVEHAHPVAREILAGLLWGGTGDDRARHNLRQALSAIRRSCGSAIESQADALRLDPLVCEVDLRDFEALARSDDSDRLRKALDLYRGPLMEGFSSPEPEFSDWLSMARARLGMEACTVASRLADSLHAQGRLEEAAVALRDLLAIDPAHEPAHRQLMAVLAESGQRSEALRQYQACLETMSRELGARPGPETRELHERIRSSGDFGDPGVAPLAENGPPPTVAAREAGPPAIAVMPFDNLSGPEEAYFADGMAEDLTTALSCFSSLLVIALSSSFALRDSKLTDAEIARKLSAQYLVRGSVRRAGSRVRIGVQLLDAEAGLHIWGHRYDRQLEDVFVLQDEITATLVSTLVGRLEANRLARARRAEPERLDAHDLVLRGRDYHHRFTPEDCRRCIEMFEQAIDRDPQYAVAHAWLACGLGQAMVFELEDLPTLLDRSEEAAQTGLALDENDAECHRVLAQVSLTRGRLSKALHHQQRALLLNPNDDRIVNAMGEMLVFDGHPEEAEQWVRKSLFLNPYHPQRYLSHLLRALYHQQRFAECLEVFDQLDMPRKDDLTYSIAALAQLGKAEQARIGLQKLATDFPGFDALEFGASMPFRREADRQSLVGPLGSLQR